MHQLFGTTGGQANDSLAGDKSNTSRLPNIAIPHASNAILSEHHGLAYFSALNAHSDVLEGTEIKICLAKRVKLADMARYRKSLVPEGAGRKIRAGNANLYLFRAIYPKHGTIEEPEKEASNSGSIR